MASVPFPTPRTRRAYDHRVREHVLRTGARSLARHVPIPRSTVSAWPRHGLRPVVTIEPLAQDRQHLLESIVKLDHRARVFAAVVRLLLALVRGSGFSLAVRERRRVAAHVPSSRSAYDQCAREPSVAPRHDRPPGPFSCFPRRSPRRVFHAVHHAVFSTPWTGSPNASRYATCPQGSEHRWSTAVENRRWTQPETGRSTPIGDSSLRRRTSRIRGSNPAPNADHLA